MTSRVPCCVPFCRRTIARENLPTEHNEWICGRHWTTTSRAWRRRLFLFRRRDRQDLEDRMWAMLKHQAIERSVGIS